MSNKLEIIEKSVGEERLARALEVLDILGVELPFYFSIYSYDPMAKKNKPISEDIRYVSSGHIYLNDDYTDNNNDYLEFDNNMMSIMCTKNGCRYYWKSIISDDGSMQDHLCVNYGALNVSFYRGKEADETSILYVYDEAWSSPHFYSDLFSVRMGDEDHKMPIDSYFDVFKSYMKGNKTEHYNTYLFNRDVVDTIINMYESPIKDLVADINDNKKSWIFPMPERITNVVPSHLKTRRRAKTLTR